MFPTQWICVLPLWHKTENIHLKAGSGGRPPTSRPHEGRMYQPESRMEGQSVTDALLYKHFLNTFGTRLFDSAVPAGALRATPEATCVARKPFNDAQDMEEN